MAKYKSNKSKAEILDIIAEEFFLAYKNVEMDPDNMKWYGREWAIKELMDKIGMVEAEDATYEVTSVKETEHFAVELDFGGGGYAVRSKVTHEYYPCMFKSENKAYLFACGREVYMKGVEPSC